MRCLACLLVLLAPVGAFAQSADLLRACQRFEQAKASGQTQLALARGEEAANLAAGANDPSTQADLLRDLGALAAQAGDEARAVRYFEQALSLEERTLGADHPDLVPVLTALADLRLKSKHYSDAQGFELRILQIERRTYGAHHENVLVTLSKLEEIYQASGDVTALSRVRGEIQAASAQRGFPAPHDLIEQMRKSQSFATVRVFYGTNRATSGSLKPALYYGKERGELQYGYLDVTIPKIHREAELETQPRWAEYVFDAGEARSRYVLLDKVVPLGRNDFLSELRKQVGAASAEDLFIFVHGFNNTFEDAARRAAQLVYDLDFDGTPLLYSWPSRGSATAYTADEAAVGISGRRLADFLETVVAQSGARHVHLLAHSMGSRALIEAVQTYLANHPQRGPSRIFGQIIFTAPDVDRDYFVDAVKPLAAVADRITLYASDTDYALRGSQLFHDAPRAGMAGSSIVRAMGLDTIDMSSVPADMLGHNYFAANSGAIFDLFRLLWLGDPPPHRCGMSDRSGSGPIVWVFNAQACAGLDLLEAGVLLKRFGDLARQRIVTDLATLTDPTQKQHLALVLRRLDGLRAAVTLPVGVAVQ